MAVHLVRGFGPVRQGETMYTEKSIPRVVQQPLGTSMAFAEGLRSVYFLVWIDRHPSLG